MNRTVIIAALFAAVFITACSSSTVQKGDYVQVTYAGAFTNGSLFDTNNPALQASLPEAPAGHFKPLTVHMGEGRVVPGFENALLGMKEGETKTVTIKSRDAYGTYDAEKLITVPKEVVFPRQVTMQRTVSMPKADFIKKTKKESVKIGEMLETQNFNYNITGVNRTHVLLFMLNASKDPIHIEGQIWNSTLNRTTPTTFVYRHVVADGDKVDTEDGPYVLELNATHIILRTRFAVGQQFPTPEGLVRVTRETDDSITLDLNHPLSGLDLVFNITVNVIEQK
jgi:FKBP-type peptidyl-prolyl cis-trans isomerase 2